MQQFLKVSDKKLWVCVIWAYNQIRAAGGYIPTVVLWAL